MSLSGITKDGKPLADYLGSTEALRVGLSKLSRKAPTARTSQGAVVYTAGQKAQKVLICGFVFNFADKVPFPPSGESIKGAIALNQQETEVQCHECGKWFPAITSTHLRVHGLSAKEYKIKHGLAIIRPLHSPVMRAKYQASTKPPRNRFTEAQLSLGKEHMRTTKSTLCRTGISTHQEVRNLRNRCTEQTLNTLRLFAGSLARTPTKDELNAYTDHLGQHPLNVRGLHLLFGTTSLRPIMLLAGLLPRARSRNLEVAPFSDDRQSCHSTRPA